MNPVFGPSMFCSPGKHNPMLNRIQVVSDHRKGDTWSLQDSQRNILDRYTTTAEQSYAQPDALTSSRGTSCSKSSTPINRSVVVHSPINQVQPVAFDLAVDLHSRKRTSRSTKCHHDRSSQPTNGCTVWSAGIYWVVYSQPQENSSSVIQEDNVVHSQQRVSVPSARETTPRT